MRSLLAVTVWPVLFVASVLVFHGTHEILGIRLFDPDTHIVLLLVAGFCFASITTFLILARTGAEVTFQWLFFAGVSMEGIALVQILCEKVNPSISDPYHVIALVIGRQMASFIAIIFGISLLLLATILDLNQESRKKQVEIPNRRRCARK